MPFKAARGRTYCRSGRTAGGSALANLCAAARAGAREELSTPAQRAHEFIKCVLFGLGRLFVGERELLPPAEKFPKQRLPSHLLFVLRARLRSRTIIFSARRTVEPALCRHDAPPSGNLHGYIRPRYPAARRAL